MKNSISKKWYRFTVCIVLIPMIVTFACVQIGINFFYAKNENIMVNQAIDSSKSYVKVRTSAISTQFEAISKEIYSLKDGVEYLYANSDEFKPKEILTAPEFPKDVTGNVIAWCPCSKETDNEKSKQEAMLLANMEQQFASVMNNFPTITTIYLATETGFNVAYDPNVLDKLELGYYSPFEMEWYRTPFDTEKEYISAPYEDSFDRGLTVSFALPFYADGQKRGVIGFDVVVENINKDILNTHFGVDDGYALLISKSGEVICADGLTEENNNPKNFLGDHYEEMVDHIKDGNDSVCRSKIKGKDCYLVQSVDPVTGWRLVAVLPVKSILEPAQISTRMLIYVDVTLILLYIIIIIFMLFMINSKCKSMTDPIVHLTNKVDKIIDGKLEYKNDLNTQDEIQVLSESFEHMTISLKKYIENFAKVTAEKERILAELSIAAQIQSDMIPKDFPYLPERKEFDLYAKMNPAKKVGGDFYDYCMIDHDHLAIVIGDVSGKGIPAALFMVVSKTLIHNHVQHGDSVAKTFTDVNNELLERNTAELFTTAWLGIYEISTGRLTYADAGHELPMKKKTDGSVEYIIPEQKKLMLAGLEDTQYVVNETMLLPGEMLLIYTDGVTEAMNEREEMYGRKRLEQIVREYDSNNPKELLETIYYKVDAFVGVVPQFDDFAMLALTVNEGEYA